MCPEYLDFFDEPGSGSAGPAAFFTNTLFDAAYFENELPRSRALRAVPVASGLRSLLYSLMENPDPAQLGFDVETGDPISWIGAPKAKTRIAFLATRALGKDSAAFLNSMSDARADWGMITDGRVWRLHSGAVFAPADNFLEMRLPELLDSERDADLKFFSLFFTPAGFGPSAAGKRGFAQAALAATLTRRGAFEKELRDAAFLAAAALRRGFIASERHATGAMPAGQGLLMVHRHALLLVYRMFYLLYAESRGMLPMSDARYENISFTRFARAAAKIKTGKNPSYALWPRLMEIFEQAWRGHKPSNAAPQTCEFFNPEAHKFLLWNKVDDAHLARAVAGLLPLADATRDADAPAAARAFAPLCDMRLALAAGKMVLIRDNGTLRWRPAASVKWKQVLERIGPGDAFIEPAPDIAVKRRNPGTGALMRLAARAVTKPGRVFDPVCGAGLALLAAADRMSLLAAQYQPDIPLPEHKRMVAMKYLYGADPNHFFAELARFAITLWSLSPRTPPASIEHRIRAGNALLGAGMAELAENVFESAPGVLDKIKNQLAELAGDIEKIESAEANNYAKGRQRQAASARIRRRTDELAHAADLWIASQTASPEIAASAAGELKNIAAGQTPPNPRAHESFLADPNDAAHPLHVEWAFPDVLPAAASNAIFESILFVSIKNIQTPISTRKFINKRLNISGSAHIANSFIKTFIPLHSGFAMIMSREFVRTTSFTKLKELFKEYGMNNTIEFTKSNAIIPLTFGL